MTGEALVSVIVVTYRPEAEVAWNCLASVVAQTYRPLELVVVDNGSPIQPLQDLMDRVCQEAKGDRTLQVRFHRCPENGGFARATNLGVRNCSGSLCVLLNPDAILAPDAVAEMARSAGSNPDILAFAPKVTLHRYPEIIDSVGIDYTWAGDAFQRGLGEVDLGQFDAPREVPGVTMGATMIRREAFEDQYVGPLDERFFMFLEDVDWCLRAATQGRRFLSVPTARVSHIGSRSAQRHRYGWRYRLLERNAYFIAVKNYESRHLMGFLVRRSRSHARNVLKCRYPISSLTVLAQGWLTLWRMRADRRAVQRRRTVSDKVFIVSPNPGKPAVTLATWTPIYSWSTLHRSIGRFVAVSGDRRWERLLRRLEVSLAFDAPIPAEEVLRRLEEEAGPIPDRVREYALKIAPETR